MSWERKLNLEKKKNYLKNYIFSFLYIFFCLYWCKYKFKNLFFFWIESQNTKKSNKNVWIMCVNYEDLNLNQKLTQSNSSEKKNISCKKFRSNLSILFAAAGSKGEKKHQCTTCSKRFASFKSLLMHYNIHKGLTKCHICDAVLSRTGNLKRHIRLKHSNVVIEKCDEDNTSLKIEQV